MNGNTGKFFMALLLIVSSGLAINADDSLKTALILSPSLKSDGGNSLRKKFTEIFHVSPEIIGNDASTDFNKLKSFSIIFSNKEIMSEEEFDALHKYVEDGGHLVAAGDFGKWLDVNKNNIVDVNADRLHPASASKLTGTSILASKASIEKIRNLSANPILRNFDVDKWIDYPLYSPSASALKTEEGSIIIAEALFHPSGYKNPDKKQSYYSSRSSSRHEAYLSAILLGKGICIRIAEDIFAVPPEQALFKALLNNLLEPSSYREFRAGIENFKENKIIYDDDSLSPNPDFNNVYPCALKEPVQGNIAVGEFIMPSDWQFNSWKGKYLAKAEKLKTEYGNFALMISSEDPDSRCGGSIWSVYCNNSTLQTGVKYKISLYAKGENITSGSFDIKFRDGNGKIHKFGSSLPAGTFDWKDFEYAFTIPKSISPKRGFIAGFSFTGPGKLYVTHYVLKEEK